MDTESSSKDRKKHRRLTIKSKTKSNGDNEMVEETVSSSSSSKDRKKHRRSTIKTKTKLSGECDIEKDIEILFELEKEKHENDTYYKLLNEFVNKFESYTCSSFLSTKRVLHLLKTRFNQNDVSY